MSTRPANRPSPSASDGTYTQRPVTLMAAFFDLERVEVAARAAGNLFGRNATRGALNIVTAQPDFELGGSASIDYGNYDSLRTTGVVNVPSAIRWPCAPPSSPAIVTGIRNNGPAVARGADDDDTRAARISALWKPDSALTARLTAEYSDRGGVGPAFYGIPVQLDGNGAVIDNHARSRHVGARQSAQHPEPHLHDREVGPLECRL